MLFDLRGRGRKNTVKVIYLFLALLMGGGLVLFGIGGNTSGGLVDAVTGGGGGDVGSKRFKAQEKSALQRIRANPSDDAAYIQLVRARIQLASSGESYDAGTNSYSADGKAELRQAVDAWTQYQATKPTNGAAEAQAASLMVRAYVALEDLAGATSAQEIVAQRRNSAGAYSQLAVLAYQAGQTRKGDLASAKALAKTDKSERAALKTQLGQAKQQATQAAPSATPGAG